MGLLSKITGKEEKDSAKLEQASVKQKIHREVRTKGDTGLAFQILKNAHVSEKGNWLTSNSKYVFKVDKKANKIEIKRAIESVYDVHVMDVNVINTAGKRRRTGRTFGRTSDWKKAIVTLKPGDKIAGLTEGI